MLARWIRAFLLTQLIEVPIYRRSFGCGLWEAFGASAITHPLVFWFSTSHFWHLRWGQRAALCELFAWWVEAAYFKAFRRDRTLLWSFVANASSFGFGLLCWYLFGFS